MSETGELGPKPAGKESKINNIFRKGWNLVVKRKEDGTADLTALPIVGSQIIKFDNQIAEKGLPLAVRDSFDKYGLHISSECPAETLGVLNRGSVLLVATHPQITDVGGVIGALPADRRDIFLLGNSSYFGAGKNAAEHLIPIYGIAHQRTRNLRTRLWRETGFELSPRPLLQTARLNIESLRIAGRRVQEGAMVIIFPDGVREQGGDWFTGVGELVKSLKDDSNAKLVFVSVEGSRSRDKFRLFPKIPQLLGQTEIKVKFSEPHSINGYVSDQSTKQSITQQLRDQYNSFSNP